jgi:UDP-glucose 4-epimerase
MKLGLKWLITGGCGFLGTTLIKKLLKEGFKNIRVIDNLSVGNRKNLNDICNFDEIHVSKVKSPSNGVELIVGDIIDPKLAIDISKEIDVIVHFAANTGVAQSVENPRVDMLTNILGTFNYLEAARINKISRFVFASSGAPIGQVEPPIHEELAAHPVSPYGASKLACEGYCSVYNKTFGIDTIALRFGNVYGPGSSNKNSVVAKFIKRAIEGNSLEIYGDGSQTRDFIYIDDLIDAVMISAKSSGIGGETFQIASNFETNIKELANMILKELKYQGIRNINLNNVSERVGDVKRNYSDISKVIKYLGWKPKTKLDEGISQTVKYFLKIYNKKNEQII